MRCRKVLSNQRLAMCSGILGPGGLRDLRSWRDIFVYFPGIRNRRSSMLSIRARLDGALTVGESYGDSANPLRTGWLGLDWSFGQEWGANPAFSVRRDSVRRELRGRASRRIFRLAESLAGMTTLSFNLRRSIGELYG